MSKLYANDFKLYSKFKNGRLRPQLTPVGTFEVVEFHWGDNKLVMFSTRKKICASKSRLSCIGSSPQ